MDVWVTIVIGTVVGLLWRRFVLARPSGGFTDMLLGITGAFGASWLVDILQRHGISAAPYNAVFVICGAALLPWSFSGFDRGQKRQPTPQATVPVDSQIADSKSDSTNTRAPAA